MLLAHGNHTWVVVWCTQLLLVHSTLHVPISFTCATRVAEPLPVSTTMSMVPGGLLRRDPLRAHVTHRLPCRRPLALLLQLHCSTCALVAAQVLTEGLVRLQLLAGKPQGGAGRVQVHTAKLHIIQQQMKCCTSCFCSRCGLWAANTRQRWCKVYRLSSCLHAHRLNAAGCTGCTAGPTWR